MLGMKLPKNTPAVDRFFDKVSVGHDSGCWEWLGKLSPKGYSGRFVSGYIDGVQQTIIAHRWSWEWANETILPEGLQIDHTCCNRRCVNPSHLQAVTHRENLDLAVARRTHCKNGHEYTEENVQYFISRHGTKSRRCAACRRERYISAKAHYKDLRAEGFSVDESERLMWSRSSDV